MTTTTKPQPLFNGEVKQVKSFSNDITENHIYVPSFGGKINHELTRLIDLKREQPLLSFSDVLSYMVELHNEKHNDSIVLSDQLLASTREAYKTATEPKPNVKADVSSKAKPYIDAIQNRLNQKIAKNEKIDGEVILANIKKVVPKDLQQAVIDGTLSEYMKTKTPKVEELNFTF